MNLNKKLTLLFLVILPFIGISAKTTDVYRHFYLQVPKEISPVSAPVFKDQQVSITDFGGKGDGNTLNTEAFRRAIEALSAKGGGKLIVQAGIWFTGPIVLKSNINLHLEKGALILFSPDLKLYPLVNTFFEGLETRRCQSPISGRNLTNVAITGEGTIDGSGDAWRPLKKSKVTDSQWKKTIKSGGILKDPTSWYPSEGALKGQGMSDMNVPRGNLTDSQWNEIKDFLRPVMISFIECKNILLQGVLFENSPSWDIHPLMCENLIVDGIFARNPAYAQNGDGIQIRKR
jgi:polygalacturonase